jgi:excisionase family DNA binding protein
MSAVIVQRNGAFTVDEFCGWARIGRSKFYQEVQEGRIPLRKIGRKSVVIRADAEAWLSSLPATA